MRAWYYQQFDADVAQEVPGESYGGWKQAELTVPKEKTALVVMHSWAAGTPALYPGWYRCVEYIPRANAICETVFPILLAAARAAGWTVFHVVGGGTYYHHLPGYQRACALAGPNPPSPARIAADPSLGALQAFRRENVFVGRHNEPDVQAGFAALDFGKNTHPEGDEGIAENGHQLGALCRDAGVNHLIYAGFAINWCLLMSPGGMLEMSQQGVLCSAIRQATTAVENRESARAEGHKEEALWRVALQFGFVFDLDDVLAQMKP